MKNIVLFASGSGSNAENIILFFQQRQTAKVVTVFCNNPSAKVLEKAIALNVPTEVFSKEEIDTEKFAQKVTSFRPDLIVLAGFLLRFPDTIIKAFPNKIINIHPALLPKYGGKGMYGMNVHHAVFNNRENETGISIHYVNENYDEGGLIFQKKINIDDCASADDIAAKIHQLEQQYFPEIIEQILNLKS